MIKYSKYEILICRKNNMGIVLFLGTVFMPYIIILTLVGLIIWLITTKLIKNKVFKTLIIISILFCGVIILVNFKDEKPDDLCKEMTEISNNKSLVGLSKEEVEELLGEPKYKFNDETGNLYAYNAGSLTKGIIFMNKTLVLDCIYGCELRIVFDEDDKVEYSSIQLLP